MNLPEKIEAAWQAKVNLDHEQCLRLVSELKQELGIRGGLLDQTEIESLLGGPAEGEVVDVLLLSAALYRALGDRERAERLLGRVEAAMAVRGSRPCFRLFYEKAMAAYVFGDFHLALEHFLHAALFAERDLHKLWALGNAVLSMENLGLPYERTYRQVRELMEKLRGNQDLQRVERQMHAFALRSAFRAGKIGEVINGATVAAPVPVLVSQSVRRRPLSESPAEARSKTTWPLVIDQARDFAHWVRSLPYHAFHGSLTPAEIEAYSSERCAIHYPFFRLRTLQGILHPEDHKVAKPSEWADRLYMWTWLWLQDPVSFPAERILVLLREVDIRDVAHRLTVEDAQLVRNALRWLGLFDPGAERLLQGVFARLQVVRSAPEFPLLTLESHLLDYLRAVRDDDRLMADDFRLSLEQHDLWNVEEIGFRALVVNVVDGDNAELPTALQKLAANLRQLWPIRSRRGSAGEPRVGVDLVHHQLVDRETGEKLVSEAACLALHLLRRGEPVGCEEFVQVCFGLRVFDPLVHTGKIFNLLTRIKRVLGTNPAFRMKAGKIMVTGDWRHIHFREHGARVHLIPILADWEEQLSGCPGSAINVPPSVRPARPAVTLTQLREWDWGGGLGRADIEGLLGTPRSTTNRYLEKWVRQGILLARGRARSTRYFLSENQREEKRHATKQNKFGTSAARVVGDRGGRIVPGERRAVGRRGENHLGSVRSS